MKVISSYPDLHSGIDGGAVAEPMTDMYVHSCQCYPCLLVFQDQALGVLNRC